MHKTKLMDTYTPGISAQVEYSHCNLLVRNGLATVSYSLSRATHTVIVINWLCLTRDIQICLNSLTD